MAIYAIGITLLVWINKKSKENTNISLSKQVDFSNNLNGISTLETLREWWKLLQVEGKKWLQRKC